MSSGGSHTGFNQSAFTAGAVGGALSIAGALVAGAANARRLQVEERDLGTREMALACIRIERDIREREWKASQTVIQAQRVTIARLESELARERAITARRERNTR